MRQEIPFAWIQHSVALPEFHVSGFSGRAKKLFREITDSLNPFVIKSYSRFKRVDKIVDNLLDKNDLTLYICTSQNKGWEAVKSYMA
jgi:hypothetical protein